MPTLIHGRTFGTLQFEEKTFKALNRPLPDNLTDNYLEYIKQPATIMETAWMMHKCKWEVRENRLYLTEMFQTHLLRKFTDSEEVLATWVDKLILHRATETIISSKSILRKENIYYTELCFKNAKLLRKNQKVSTVDFKGYKKTIIKEHCQEGIFTFDRDDVVLKNKKICLKGRDVLLPYLEEDINVMLRTSHKGISLSMKDVNEVVENASIVTYLCESIVCNAKYRKVMQDNIDEIINKIKVMTDGKKVNYLVHIDMDEKFDFEIVKEFMECMYDLGDERQVLIGFNEHKKEKVSKGKEDVFDDCDEVPSEAFIKVFMGVS